ncbi:MAG: phytanoyl-CoA dioxygenase family protein [Rhodocyclaceae bacterium]|nr:phytanoyl-CoA dioxygenase family protein [Rhodocyclaceae bacterium]
MTQSTKNSLLPKQLTELATQGYTIIDDFLDTDRLRRVRAGLAPFLNSHHGRNNFEGVKTERVYTLVGRGRIFEEIVEDQRVLDILDALFLPNYLLTASQAICISPGETAQPIHSDDSFYPIPRPRPAISISTIVAVDAFTASNGCTEIIPGSHLWSDAEVAGTYDGLDHDAPTPPAIAKLLIPLIMPAGSCVVFQGTLLHRGGANRSDAPRLAFPSVLRAMGTHSGEFFLRSAAVSGSQNVVAIASDARVFCGAAVYGSRQRVPSQQGF